ncbi:uncharacterized protein LOC110682787 [Chenopodium quinoa]|nr:uncharacterized protein LOC110682787 [Chenopodium quinoa]
MLLGKRARRHPMKRTTSMTEFSYDDLSIIHPHPHPPPPSSSSDQPRDGVDHPYNTQHLHKVMGFVSPRGIHRRNSADFALQSSNSPTNNTFLRTCCLCSRRLAPGRDIYMYRGDSAFCSLECRQQQMTQDERKEKCTPKESNSSSSHPTPVSSSKSEKIAAL